MAELADAAGSKSAALRVLGVRLPLPAPAQISEKQTSCTTFPFAHAFARANAPEVSNQDARPSPSQILLILSAQLREAVGIRCHDTIERQLLLREALDGYGEVFPRLLRLTVSGR